MLKKLSVKVLSLLVAFLMVFSSFALAAETTPGTGTTRDQMENLIKQKMINELNKTGGKWKTLESLKVAKSAANTADDSSNLKSSLYNRLDLYKDKDKVRVIIEVEGDSIADYAKKSGKNISNVPNRNAIQNSIFAEQKRVKQSISKVSADIKFRYDFATILNGFSAEISRKDLDKVNNIPGVKKVTIANIYYPDMNEAVGLTEADKVWDAEGGGYQGEGMLVAIIDTGIDFRHDDLKNIDETKIKWTQDAARAKLADTELNLKGKIFTNKVIVGWNWADNNDQIIDYGPDASMHGMHVAGIVAANGDPSKGGIKGVAPQAQLLAEKVFSNSQETGAYTDDIVAAINHAIAFNADVLNMSLGSPAGYVLPDDPEQSAIQKAVDNGVICAISAGNEGRVGLGLDLYGLKDNPYYKNPDIGLVGSPGLAGPAVQGAASYNLFKMYEHEVSINGNKVATGYGTSSWKNVTSGEIVYVPGYGALTDYKGLDVKDKIVLVVRGDLSFYGKSQNAAAKGAKGIIVYDHGSGTFFKDQTGVIPFMLVSKAEGEALVALVKGGSNQAAIKQTKGDVDPTSGLPVYFSSWGPSPNLDFKPDLMAPGVNIFSLANNNQYQHMSGTSMASPHIAGGMALIKQAIEDKTDNHVINPNDELTTVQLAKVLGMNTAEPVKNQYGYEYQPRVQGAGMLQILKANTTPVYITDDNKNAGISLKEIGSTKTFNLNLTNMTNTAQTYKVSGTLATDYVAKGLDSLISVYMTEDDYDSEHIGKVSFDKDTVTVPANSSVKVAVTVNIEKAPKNIFVEGYVYFQPEGNDIPRLSVPYIGFYGDWNDPKIIDPVSEDEDSFVGATGLLTEVLSEGGNIYTDAISPKGNDGDFDFVMPVLTLLRNAKDLIVNIKDGNGNLVKTVDTESYLRKICRIDEGADPYLILSDAIWDGTNRSNKYVTDGQYSVELKSRIQYENAKWQTLNLPVKVDNTKPQFKITKIDDKEITPDFNYKFDDADGKLKLDFSTYDNLTGIAITNVAVFELGSNGYPTGNKTLYDIDDPKTTSLEINLPYERNDIAVVGLDGVYNSGMSQEVFDITNKALEEEEGAPVIVLNSPINQGTYGTRTVPVSGYIDSVKPFTGVLKVNGNDVPVEADNSFNTFVTFEKDGWGFVTVEAYDPAKYNPENPGTFDFRRTFAYKLVIDATPPQVSVNLNEIKGSIINNNICLDVPVRITDDVSIFHKLTVNGDVLVNTWFDDFTKIDQTIDYTGMLDPDSKINITYYNVAENTASLTLTHSVVDGKHMITDGNSTVELNLTAADAYTGPTVEITSPTEIVNNADNIDFTVKASSILGISEVYINGREVKYDNDKQAYVLNIPLVNEENKVTVRAIDKIGMETKVEYTVRCDIAGPTIDFDTYLSKVTMDSTTLKGKVTDVSGVKPSSFKINGTVVELNEGSFEYTVKDLVSGNNDVVLTAEDNNGHVTNETIKIIRDITAPVVTFIPALPDSTIDNTITVTGNIKDETMIKSFTINDSDVIINDDGYFQKDIKLINGINSIIVKAADEMGNEYEKPYVVICNSDPQIDPPTEEQPGMLGLVFDEAALSQLDSNKDLAGIQIAYGTRKIDVSGSVDKEYAGKNITLKVNGKPVAITAEGKFTAKGISLKSGINTITADAMCIVDNNRIEEIYSTTVVLVEKSRPTVTITNPKAATAYGNSEITIAGKVSEVGIVELYQDRVCVQTKYTDSKTFSFNVEDLADGTYVFTVKAYDMSGNVSAAMKRNDTRTFVIDTTKPVIDSFKVTASGVEVADGSEIKTAGIVLSGKITDNNEKGYYVYYKIGDTGRVYRLSVYNMSFSKKLTLRYGVPTKITLWAADRSGNLSDEQVFTVTYKR